LQVAEARQGQRSVLAAVAECLRLVGCPPPGERDQPLDQVQGVFVVHSGHCSVDCTFGVTGGQGQLSSDRVEAVEQQNRASGGQLLCAREVTLGLRQPALPHGQQGRGKSGSQVAPRSRRRSQRHT
jgi:hypothetical protein